MRAEEPLSILQVCSAREAIYGAVQSLMTLAREQRHAGHRVEFLTFKGKRFGAQVREQGFEAHEVKVRGKIDPLAILRMRSLIRRNRYDLVHTHLSTSSVNGALAARLAKVPCISTVHGMSGKLSFVAANHLIAVSEQVKLHLVRQGLPEERISVVYNGLELEPCAERSTARKALGIAEQDGPVLGTVSRVTKLKGIDDAIRALALLREKFPKLRYIVVGDGDALDECRELARSLNLEAHVQFLGYRNDIANVLAAMDLFVFPSHKEAMGIALIEAMACSLPVVATEIGGIPEVVTCECGVLTPVRNPEALAAAARELLVHPEKMQSMGMAALQRVKDVFSAAAMERSTDWVYRDLLGQHLRFPAEGAEPAKIGPGL